MKGFVLSLLAATAAFPSYSGASLVTPAYAPLTMTQEFTQPSARVSTSAPMAVAPTVSEWLFAGLAETGCELATDGTVLDEQGASVDVSCAQQARVMGNVQARMSAQGLRQRRVTLSVELQADDAMNVSLWLKTQRDNKTLMFDDDTEQHLLNNQQSDGWVQRTITLPVASNATQISFGVLLQGGGAVQLRNVHVDVSDFGAIAPEATRLLDAAIDIVKQQTSARSDLSWSLLEPQLRLFASGAQTTAEVYPAIKYLLSRLGDKQSLLLTPEVATALSQATADVGNGSKVSVFALPDGARLVLAQTVAEPALRTAQNLARPEALP